MIGGEDLSSSIHGPAPTIATSAQPAAVRSLELRPRQGSKTCAKVGYAIPGVLDLVQRVKRLDAAALVPDVVPGPADAELLATDGEPLPTGTGT